MDLLPGMVRSERPARASRWAELVTIYLSIYLTGQDQRERIIQRKLKRISPTRSNEDRVSGTIPNYATPGPALVTVAIPTPDNGSFRLDNDLVDAQITLSADSMTGQTTITCRNDSNQYGTPGSPLLEPGDPVQIWFYKQGQSVQQNIIFTGPLQSIKYKKDIGGSGNKYLLLRAADGSAYLQNRMVNAAYQTYAVTSNPGYRVDYIVNDLLTNTANWMATQYGINYSGAIGGSGYLGLHIGNSGIQTIPVFIQNIEFQQMSLFSALSQLAQYAGCSFFVSQTNAGANLNFFELGTNPSSVAITDPVITSWECEDDGTNLQNVIYVDGGSQLTVDSQNAVTNFSTSPPEYAIKTYQSTLSAGKPVAIYAQQFTAGNLNLTELGTDTVGCPIQCARPRERPHGRSSL